MTAMSAERRARLVALGELHRTWAAGAVKSAAFRPDGRPDGSDYNQHNADVDATAAREDTFHRKARQIMGLDPATGRRPAVT
jgi:hypothetical protein